LFPVLGVTVLVPHNQNTDAGVQWPIDYGVREAGERKPAALPISGCADSWVLNEQIGDSFELIKEPCCYGTTPFTPVEPCRLGEIKLRAAVKASRSSEFSA